ncbi:prephenate dehydrogenase/arogenate dehydrogenase family protein [Streptomyces sp. NPDC048606]|uniref:prephenate dehydrogenase/arogenate dehydrogenase family protein n=1 Tax=Streptomyces sp. NPDC048606 TaxID=3154726 RepID=UPI00343B0886
MTGAGPRRVTVIGCTVTGTSIALALAGAGVEVTLDDPDADALAAAVRLGAGTPLTDRHPPADLVVVATDPHDTVDALVTAQARGLGHVYTDTAGTTPAVRSEAALRGCDLLGHVPGHPLAGRRGPTARTPHPALFAGRPWILCPHPDTDPRDVTAVAHLARLCGADPRSLAPDTTTSVPPAHTTLATPKRSTT